MTDLLVDAERTVTLQAAEGLLDLPRPGLDPESFAAGHPDQRGADAAAAQEDRWISAGEAAVEPYQQQGGVRIEVRAEGARGIAVLHVGRHHLHAQRIALGVDHQHALAAIVRNAGGPVCPAGPACAGWPAGVFLSASYPRGPRCGPVFTLCVSTIAASGLHFRPAARRRQAIRTRSARSRTARPRQAR